MNVEDVGGGGGGGGGCGHEQEGDRHLEMRWMSLIFVDSTDWTAVARSAAPFSVSKEWDRGAVA